MRSFTLKSFAALLFGLFIPLALAPFNFWPLIFVGVGGFFWLSSSITTTKQALWFGWLYGVGFFGLGVSWVFGSMQTVGTPLPLAVLLTSGFCLLLALLHAFQLWFFVRFLAQLRYSLVLAAPLWWLVCEWVREWLLTGMPWLFSGYALLPTPAAQAAAVVGIYGLSLFVALISALLLKAVLLFNRQHKSNAIAYAFAATALFVAAMGWGLLKPASSWTNAETSLIAAAVQSNVDQRSKWFNEQQRPTLEFYGNSIANMSEADFVLWPEAAMTRLPEQIPNFIAQIEQLGEDRGQAIITGTLSYEDGRYYNAMKGYGVAEGEYKKQHLVPFGEYVPFAETFKGLFAIFDIPMSTMHQAPQQQSPLLFTLNNQPYFAAAIICYEAAYPNLVKTLAKDAEIIAVVSNDAWFGDSLGPHQHLQITQMRAIENGRAIVRATQNGISALIDANGHIVQRSEQFVEAEVMGEVSLRTGLTPFQRLPAGLVAWLCLVSLLGQMALGYRQPRQN